MEKKREIIECLQILLPKTTFNSIKPHVLRQILKNELTTNQTILSEIFLQKMDLIIRSEIKGIVNSDNFIYNSLGITTWHGDITSLNVDGIVNAANSNLLGCFVKNHKCIDNTIHSKAGPRLRNYCIKLMNFRNFKQEDTGKAIITPGFCLPSNFILHTVGPIARFEGDEQPELLESCYKSCLDLAKENNLRSIAFCCISTGIFGYPNKPATKIAIDTVILWKKMNVNYDIKVIFNTFAEKDKKIYENILM